MRRSYGSIEFIFVFIYLFTAEKVQPFIGNKFLIYNYDEIIIDIYHPALETGGST